MDLVPFEVRQCSSGSCNLRFPASIDDSRRYYCPICHAKTVTAEAFSRHEVVQGGKANNHSLVVVLDNIRSSWNVGAIFRSSDGCGVEKMFLCGITPSPIHPGVVKTALGAELHLPWSHHKNGLDLINNLKGQGYQIWALEGGESAVPLFSTLEDGRKLPIALVVGNELTGVDPGILRVCDKIVYLPMLGMKNSLNVAVAFGIAVYTIQFGNA